jgi:LPXTG-site transpeptidase (sortase) family protein
MTTDPPEAPGPGMSATLRRFLSRLAYPAIYFAVATLALYLRLGTSAGTQRLFATVWTTVVLLPTLVGVVGLVAWAVIDHLSSRRRASLRDRPGGATGAEGAARPAGGARLVMQCAGALLVAVGLIAVIWLARPYVRLLLASSDIARLERKAASGEVRGDWIIIPSALVDAPVVEGTTDSDLARAIAHLAVTGTPGSGRNVVLEGHNLAELGAARPNELFSLLETVRDGAMVYLFWNGKRYAYRVHGKTYKNAGRALLEPQLGERLTLVTCVSSWSLSISTTRRTVVTALPDGW